MQRGVNWFGVRGVGWALRKCAIEPGDVGKERVWVGVVVAGVGFSWDEGVLVVVVVVEGVLVVVVVEGAVEVVGGGGSTTIETSWSWSWSCSCSWVEVAAVSSGRVRAPSESCLNMRLTAMMPAAPVSAARSAPT